MARQNLADRSTMEVVSARQVADGVASQVSGYNPCLFGCVEAVLDLLSDLTRTVAFGLFFRQRSSVPT